MKFTIITITYNASDVLQATLDSVASQTYKNIEHLIIDGASTDDTLGMAEAYRTQNSSEFKIRVFCEPDRGIYDAMNKGLRMAMGDYVVFVNAGDRLASPDTLADIHAAAQRYANEHDSGNAMKTMPDVIFGDTDLIDATGTRLGPRHLSAPNVLTWKSFRRGMLVCHQAFYVKRQIAQRTVYDLQYRFSADVDWCIRCLKQAKDCLRVEPKEPTADGRALVVALYLKEGTTTKNHRASLIERFKVMSRHYGWLTTVLMHLWFCLRR